MNRRLIVFLPVLLGAAVLATTWELARLPQAARVIAAAFLGGAFLVALLGTRPDVRAHATVALAAAAVTAAGQTRAGTAYVALSVVFAIGSVVAIRIGRGAFTPRYRGPRLATIVLAVTAAALGAALFVGLPPVARRIEMRIGRYVEPDDMPVGFSSRLALGSTRRMLKSSRIVLRVHGERVEYLRGAVLDSYGGLVWSSSLADRSGTPLVSAALDSTTTRIVFASGAPIAKPPETRWFLPPGACNLHTASGHILPDGMGIAHPERAEEEEIDLRVGGCAAPELAPPPPGRADVDFELPSIRRELAPIAAEWTAGATSDRQKVERITARLQRFPYVLDVERDERVDPVVDFLKIHREGHCEMFASALALLARTQGIPTRVVTGYRVSEVSPIFGYSVVRERNAHAWVDVWLDGAWHTWDPTPPDESLAGSRPGLFDRAGEATSYLWDLGGPWALAGVAALAGLVYYVRRWLADLRARLGARLARGPRPSPGFVALETALERAGHARPPSEPLEHFARRIVDAGPPWADEVAAALAAYAALRYGGVGHEREIAQALERAASRVTS
jgi:hypothetical protein